jgi:hypothetical protein
MGRGLSELQRWILRRASTQRRLYYPEILEGFFGWKPKQPFRRYKEGEKDLDGQPAPVGDLANVAGQHFSSRTIGEERYRKVMFTLRRSCARLEERGLVERIQRAYAGWRAVKITQKGREWLSVNSAENRPRVNR